MEQAPVGDAELEYEVVGVGEPVVFIHGAFVADALVPLRNEDALGDRYRLIFYRRRGYVGSSPVAEPVGVPQQAADCAALLAYLDVERAHVVAHSYGGCVALQLAREAPELVHSLVLLEPGLAVGASGPGYREALARGTQRFREAAADVVVDEFLEARWTGYRDGLEAALPGAFVQAVADARTWFDFEMSGQLEWLAEEFPWTEIEQPTLSVVGGASNELWPRFGEVHQFLLETLPDVEGFILPGATHFLQLETAERRRGLADALAGFLGRHPFSAGSLGTRPPGPQAALPGAPVPCAVTTRP